MWSYPPLLGLISTALWDPQQQVIEPIPRARMAISSPLPPGSILATLWGPDLLVIAPIPLRFFVVFILQRQVKIVLKLSLIWKDHCLANQPES